MQASTRVAASVIVGMVASVAASMPSTSLLTVQQRDTVRSARAAPSAAISSDGRYIAFASYARLTPEDTDDRSDIYILDRLSKRATLESISGDFPLDADCLYPRVSGDAQYVVFQSTITPAVGSGILVRDRRTQTTRLVSRSRTGGPPNGWSADAAISGDGGTIVFASTATDLVDGPDTNGRQPDVYLFRTASGRIQRISLTIDGIQPSAGASVAPSVSGDGRYAVLTSTALLVPLNAGSPARQNQDSRGPLSDVYLVDTALGLVSRIAPKGLDPNGPSMSAVISADGGSVAFSSRATNLVANDRNGMPDVFVFERGSGTIALVSRTRGGRTANGASASPSISSDGRLVAFQSDASDLACSSPPCSSGVQDLNLLFDAFVHDRTTGITTWISRDSDAAWVEESVAPVIDDRGSVIAFSSRHPTDSADARDDFDLFVRVSDIDAPNAAAAWNPGARQVLRSQ